MQMVKFDFDAVLLKAILVALLVILVGVILMIYQDVMDRRNAPCSHFATRSVKDVPARCLKYWEGKQ